MKPFRKNNDGAELLAVMAATIASGLSEYLVKTGYGNTESQRSVADNAVKIAEMILDRCDEIVSKP